MYDFCYSQDLLIKLETNLFKTSLLRLKYRSRYNTYQKLSHIDRFLIVGVLSGLVVLIIVVVLFFVWLRRRRRHRHTGAASHRGFGPRDNDDDDNDDVTVVFDRAAETIRLRRMAPGVARKDE